ncbi:hypothetical protein ERS044043_00966, partial [Streptococcus pneumoniae]
MEQLHFITKLLDIKDPNIQILDKLLSYSEDLKHHYQLYQLLLFHFQ